LWTTEFGRMPTNQQGVVGRDHNPDGFTCWMMGAGVKAGATIGATDELGRRAAIDPITVWDYYATVLHLLGFDHKQLTYYHNGLAAAPENGRFEKSNRLAVRHRHYALSFVDTVGVHHLRFQLVGTRLVADRELHLLFDGHRRRLPPAPDAPRLQMSAVV